jgi:hypothetical protein
MLYARTMSGLFSVKHLRRVYYALRRGFTEKRPLIWLYNGTYYLLLREGVYAHARGFPKGVFQENCLDLGFESSSGIPPELVCHGTRVFDIFHVSRQRAMEAFGEDRYSSFRKP